MMAKVTYGPHLLTEDDIPGSSLSGRNPASIRNPEIRLVQGLDNEGTTCKKVSIFQLLVHVRS